MRNALILAAIFFPFITPATLAADTVRFSYRPTDACNGMKNEPCLQLKTTKRLSNSNLISSAKKTLLQRVQKNSKKNN